MFGQSGAVTSSVSVAEVLLDGFARVREGVTEVLADVEGRILTWRSDPSANTVAWIIWHLTRIQDDHLAAAFEQPQVWLADGWVDRFALPYPREAHGYGMSPEAVGRLTSSRELLVGYSDAVAGRTESLIADVTPEDLARIVDDRWDPPVTLAVRLVSVLSDDLQHVGQAAHVRGLAERA